MPDMEEMPDTERPEFFEDEDYHNKQLAKLTTLKGIFGDYINEVHTSRQYYNRDFGAEVVPPRWASRLTPLIPQTARRSIDEPADHILTFPVIKVPVRPTMGSEAAEQTRADVVREACNAWWAHIARQDNIIGDCRKPLLNEGKIAIRKTIKWELLPEYPDRDDYRDTPAGKREYTRAVNAYRRELERLNRAEFLWKVELLDNCTVFEDPSNHRDPRYAFITYSVYVEEACEQWPESTGDWRDRDDLEEVTYTELWTKPGPVMSDGTWEPGHFIQWIENEVVHADESPYPYLPIVIDDAGFGLNHQLAKPEDRYVGMTQHARDLFRAQAEARTSWLAVSRLAAFPMGVARNMASDKEINLGPGEIIDMEGNEGEAGAESLNWMSHPDIPQGVVTLGDVLEREANSTFKIDVLGGIPQKGVDTATEADMNVRNAIAKLSGPISAIERVCIRLTRQFLMDVELVLKAPVTLYGSSASSKTPAEIVLKPTDVNGFYEVHVELSTSDQEVMQLSKARFWLEAPRVNPALSYQYALEEGDIVDDGMSEMIKRATEDVYMSPEFQQMRKSAAASELGMVLQEAQKTTAPTQNDQMSMLGPAAEQRMNPALAGGGPMPGGLEQQIVAQGLQNRDAVQAQGMFR
jgi:hypothetical protein